LANIVDATPDCESVSSELTDPRSSEYEAMQVGEIRLASSISSAVAGKPELYEALNAEVDGVLQQATIVTSTARNAVRRAVTSAIEHTHQT
jgi:hypothetical protein